VDLSDASSAFGLAIIFAVLWIVDEFATLRGKEFLGPFAPGFWFACIAGIAIGVWRGWDHLVSSIVGGFVAASMLASVATFVAGFGYLRAVSNRPDDRVYRHEMRRMGYLLLIVAAACFGFGFLLIMSTRAN
jgi:hypothetical protein